MDLKSYSEFGKRNSICLICSSTVENHVVYTYWAYVACASMRLVSHCYILREL